MCSGMTGHGLGRALVMGLLMALFGSVNTQAWVVAPYIQELRSDSATLMWESAAPAPATLHYGPAGAEMTEIALPPTVALQQVQIEGLAADTVYRYRLESDSEFQESQFRTAPDTARSVTVVLIGNTHAWGDRFEATDMASHLTQWEPDLILHTGNLVDDATDPDAWRRHFNRFAGLLDQYWMFVARGRQDGSLLGEQAQDLFRNYLGPMQGDSGVYEVIWGNTRFVVVAHESLLRTAEMLESYLENQGPSRTMVLSHTPLYSAGLFSARHSQTQTPSGAREGLVRNLERYGIPLYLSGSLPLYERSFPLEGGARNLDGVSYLVQGGGIGGHYPAAFTATSDRQEGLTAPTYTVLGMEPDQIWLRSFVWHASETAFVEVDHAILDYPIRLLRETLQTLEAAEEEAAVRDAIARLGALGHPEACEALIAYLDATHPAALRQAAALALQRIASAAHAKALLPYLEDADHIVRQRIARALEAGAPRELTRELGAKTLDESQDPIVREKLLGAVHRHGPAYFSVDIAEQLLLQPTLPHALEQRAAFALRESADRRDFEVLLERVRAVSTPEALFWLGEALNELTRGEVVTAPDSAFMASKPGAARDGFIEDWRYYMERRLLTERRQEQGRGTATD